VVRGVRGGDYLGDEAVPVKYHHDLEQGSDEWVACRIGLLTASEMKHVITPTLKVADNKDTRVHLYELLAQRITSYVEPHYYSDDMLRGHDDEERAKALYSKHYAPVTDCGFITNDKWGFTIGYSPDGLVGEHGLIECKSRRQKYQVQTFVENIAAGTAPTDFIMQCQTALLVSERQWLDFITYCGGLPMGVVRVWPDDAVHDAIVSAAKAFEVKLQKALATYRDTVASDPRFFPTERIEEMEMIL
jgi:YqaJ-like viral recombinase domain